MNRRQFLLAAAVAIGVAAPVKAVTAEAPRWTVVRCSKKRSFRGDGFADVVIEGLLEFRGDVTAAVTREAFGDVRRTLCMPGPHFLLCRADVRLGKCGRRIEYRCEGKELLVAAAELVPANGGAKRP